MYSVRDSRARGFCLNHSNSRLLKTKQAPHTVPQWRRPRAPSAKEEGEEEEEEGLFKADAVNEEDPERDRATKV